MHGFMKSKFLNNDSYNVMLRNEQIEFHTLINSVTEEFNRNRSRWWLMNDLQG